jgi:hypothetical protein
MDKQAVHLGPKRTKVLEVLRANGAPAGLVFVSRADSPSGGADPVLAGGRLAQLVEFAMERQDQRGILGDLEAARADVDAPLLQRIELGDEMPRIEHHSVADDAELAGAHHAGRQQR